MSKNNRSICDPAKPCPRCGARPKAAGFCAFAVRCECGQATAAYMTMTEACDAWDRGEFERKGRSKPRTFQERANDMMRHKE